MERLSHQHQTYLGILLATIALLFTVAGNVGWIITVHNNGVKAHENRVLIAQTEEKLCTTIYGQFENLIQQSLSTTNFAAFKKLVPSLSDSEIRNLVANDRKILINEKKTFALSNCQRLPSHRFLR